MIEIMRIFNRPIFVSQQDRLFAKGQKKLFEEMRQEHQDDIARATALPVGYVIKLEGGITQAREEWLAAAAIELTELAEQIDALSEYI